MAKKLLLIGHTFPEPSTTAAGQRMLQLIALFQKMGYEISFGSTASIGEHSMHLDTLGISSELLQLNHPSFDEYIRDLDPSVVIFDRYITEEQFGWRVAEQCPNAFRILDTEDLHFLRKARQEAVLKNTELDIYSDTAKRELASILRCDLALIISEVEMALLQDTFQIPPSILYYLPFLVSPISEEKKLTQHRFESRNHFVTIGNLLHAPNVDSILYVKKAIWPLLRQHLPSAKLFVYGNYAPQHILQLHQPKEGFYIEGWASDAHEVLVNARICLAPLRFGAGLKGKFIDAMQSGTPLVTTSVGAEGMFGGMKTPGGIFDDPKELVEAAVRLYTNEADWQECQLAGYDVLAQRFSSQKISEAFIKHLSLLLEHRSEHRKAHFLGAILQHQTLQATKYMSKWIAEKNN